MADRTKIEWTDATWNPLRGCSRVSDGCRNCYAERMAARFCGPRVLESDRAPFDGFAEITPSGPRWTGRVELMESQLDIPLRWRKPRWVFLNSMSDTFHEALKDGDIDQMFAVMALCPQHRFLVLTKRAERMQKWCIDPDTRRRVAIRFLKYDGVYPRPRLLPVEERPDSSEDDPRFWAAWPLPNVWMGVTAENQEQADNRIGHLLRTPAAGRFVSIEPMLAPVNLDSDELEGLHALGCGDPDCKTRDILAGCHGVDWVIAGCESGPRRRPADIQWFRDLRDQCVAAGVPFFLKQIEIGGQLVKMPALDGRVWDQQPEA